MGWFGFYGLRVGFCSRKFFLGKLPEGGFLMTVVLRLICDFSFLSFFELFSVVFWGFDSAFCFLRLGRGEVEGNGGLVCKWVSVHVSFFSEPTRGSFLTTMALLVRLLCDFSLLKFFSVVFWGFDSAFVFCVWDVGKLREMVSWFGLYRM